MGCTEDLLDFRRLHVNFDTVVCDAFGWQELVFGHDFNEVESLPENDRTRYTITPTARREILKRLLALNHERALQGKQATLITPKVKKTKGSPWITWSDLRKDENQVECAHNEASS